MGLVAAAWPWQLSGSQALPMSVVAGDLGRVVFASFAKIDSGDVKKLLHIVDDELSKGGAGGGFPPAFELIASSQSVLRLNVSMEIRMHGRGPTLG